MKKKQYYDFLHIFCQNGWDWNTADDDWPEKDCYEYTNTFTSDYQAKVTAIVSCNQNHLKHHCHYGILWLEVSDYECGDHYSINELKEMMSILDIAEKHLLTIGMPFVPDYEFISNKGNRKRRNEKLRRIYELEEKEMKDKGEIWKEKR
jgi:hypothetical protein